MYIKGRFIKILCKVAVCVSPLFALDSFDLHRINDAHAMGYSGYGVNVGIADTKFNPNHNALQGKFIYTDKNQYTNAYNASQRAHGSNVAGVVGANYTDGKYFGVAYGAKLAGFGEFGNSVRSGASNGFILNNDIRIINHSWAYTNYNQYFREFEGLVINHKVLMVFASGNYANQTPSYPANNPRHNEALQSWITVGNLDSHYISRNDSGNLVVSSRGVSTNSNLCFGSSRFCVMASGTNIRTTDGNSNDKFSTVTGTSFSAPLVSGVAALVQEKFPFMNGKQLADVILGTANRDFIAPKLIIKGNTLIYIDSEIPTDSNQIKADVMKAYGYARNYTSTIKATREEVFGQGIVDAVKALGGISLIDINRLSDKDAFVYKNESVKEAFYELDLGSYDATFSNDIEQRKWDAKYHDTSSLNRPTQLNNLNAGLLKKGSGTLTITGDLEYLGATIVQGGKLSLSQSQNRTTLSVAGNLYVESNAKLHTFGNVHLKKSLFIEQGRFQTQGQTTIGQNLNNNNGDITIESGSTLNIKGTYTQDGANSKLTIGFGEDKGYSLTSAKYDIKSGNLIYNPQIGTFKNTTLAIPLEESLLNQMNNFSSITLANNANMLNYALSSDKKSIVITTKDDAYENFDGANKSVAKSLRTLSAQSRSKKYVEFFSMLNSTSYQNYTDIVKSIDNSAYLSHTAYILSLQSNNSVRQILNSQISQSQGSRFSLTPYYSYSTGLNGENMNGHFAGSHLFVDKVFDSGVVGGFFSYGKYDSNFKNARFDAHILQGGINFIGNIASFKIMGNASVGGSFNIMNRSLYNDIERFDSEYNHLLANANLGFGYDIKSTSGVFTPQILANYGFIKQNAFKEKTIDRNGILAVQHSAIQHNLLSVLAGFNWTQKWLDNKLIFGINAFYERKILGSALNSSTQLIDNATQNITHAYNLAKDSGILGISIGYNGERSFITLNIDSAINAKSVSVGAIVEFGLKFGAKANPKISIKKGIFRQISQDSTKSQSLKEADSAIATKDSAKPLDSTLQEKDSANVAINSQDSTQKPKLQSYKSTKSTKSQGYERRRM